MIVRIDPLKLVRPDFGKLTFDFFLKKGAVYINDSLLAPAPDLFISLSIFTYLA